MYLTVEALRNISFQLVRETVLFQARVVTIADYEQYNITMHTREGIAHFPPGNYLAHDIQQEDWSIACEQFLFAMNLWVRLKPTDFALYRTLGVYGACQILLLLTIQRANGDILQGKVDDYLLLSDLVCGS